MTLGKSFRAVILEIKEDILGDVEVFRQQSTLTT
jgi:hypothetical protein